MFAEDAECVVYLVRAEEVVQVLVSRFARVLYSVRHGGWLGRGRGPLGCFLHFGVVVDGIVVLTRLDLEQY